MKPLYARHGTGYYSPTNDTTGSAQYFGPRDYAMDGTVRGVIFSHGAGGNEAVPFGSTQSTNVSAVMREVASIYPVLSCTFTGQQHWGNDAALTALTDAVNFLKGTFGAKTGKVLLIGQSMGHLHIANWARANPSLVAGIVGILPVSDLNDLVTNNRGSTAAAINAAYGGAYSESTNGPTKNPANYAATGLVGIPWRGYYASDDTLVLPGTVTGLASSIGSTATATSLGTGGHADGPVANVDIAQLLTFLASVA